MCSTKLEMLFEHYSGLFWDQSEIGCFEFRILFMDRVHYRHVQIHYNVPANPSEKCWPSSPIYTF